MSYSWPMTRHEQFCIWGDTGVVEILGRSCAYHTCRKDLGRHWIVLAHQIVGFRNEFLGCALSLQQTLIWSRKVALIVVLLSKAFTLDKSFVSPSVRRKQTAMGCFDRRWLKQGLVPEATASRSDFRLFPKPSQPCVKQSASTSARQLGVWACVLFGAMQVVWGEGEFGS